jgi:hypothetical protein
MAAKAKLSVLGLYQWDHDIFADMAIPEDVDGETLTWKILEDCAELEILYSDPEYMKASLHNWSSAMLPNWNKMQEALTAEYNPIWNKDGTIQETRTYGAQAESRTYGAINETSSIGAQTTTNNFGARSQENTHQVAGYNSDTLNNAERDQNSIQPASDTVNNGARQDSANRSAHTDTADREAYTDKFTRTEQGNIGVTESSAMVQHEVELRQKFNIYDIITADFKKHYCLQIY